MIKSKPIQTKNVKSELNVKKNAEGLPGPLWRSGVVEIFINVERPYQKRAQHKKFKNLKFFSLWVLPQMGSRKQTLQRIDLVSLRSSEQWCMRYRKMIELQNKIPTALRQSNQVSLDI